jgi:hypothetical protein
MMNTSEEKGFVLIYPVTRGIRHGHEGSLRPLLLHPLVPL